MKLSGNFYTRGVHTVAKELLGKLLVRGIKGSILSGIIVEVEAYDGSIDEAAHTFRGRTARNEVMYQKGGVLYVYFTYGMHYCCNVVTGKGNEGKAVLIRAIEPVQGIARMCINRFSKEEITQKEYTNLTNGPAKVCKALGIGLKENGTVLTGQEIYIIDRSVPSGEEIGVSKRIGIKKSVDLPWRYYLKDNRFVSKK